MYKFHSASAYPWKKGALFLGHDERGGAVGISTERHAITIAGSQSGKGVGVIIPNLLRWPHNALVIDPKGEAAKETLEAREAMGCPSFVFDPFQTSSVPAHLRVTINPMHGLNPNSFTITEDIGVIADGIVMRPDPQAAHWDDGAAALLSGLIAWVLLHYPEEERNLLTVRKIQRNTDLFAETIEAMRDEEGCGGLCQTGAAAAYAKEGGYFVSNAEKNTRWLDSLAMQKALGQSTFDMDALKWGNASLFLVLPSKYLKQHGRFLRLFVRTAIDTMQQEQGGKIRGNDCLFLLDEFFALGYIDEIATTAGLMAGYGLKLWPILQDIEQLRKLYGKDGAATFFGSSDLHQFFGNMDDETLEYVSRKIGNYNVDDLPDEPRFKVSDQTKDWDREVKREGNRLFFLSNLKNMEYSIERRTEHQNLDRMAYQEELSRFNTTASRVLGKPRLPPDALASLIKKPERGPAKNMIAIVHGGKPLCVRLAPYYLDPRAPASSVETGERSENAPIEQIETGEIEKSVEDQTDKYNAAQKAKMARVEALIQSHPLLNETMDRARHFRRIGRLDLEPDEINTKHCVLVMLMQRTETVPPVAKIEELAELVKDQPTAAEWENQGKVGRAVSTIKTDLSKRFSSSR